MRKSSLPAGARQFNTSRHSFIRPVLGLSLATVLLGASVLPVHAWWFSNVTTTPNQVASATSSNSSGLSLSPLLSWVPQFILQPLPANPTPTPTTQPAVQPTAKPTIKPTLKPTIAATTAQTSIPQSTVQPEVQRILDLVNQERTSRGLNALVLQPQLIQSAQKYAEQMQQYQFFDHVSKVDGTTFKDRNEAAGYTNWSWMGENIAYGQPTAEEVMKEWMNSQGHRDNILNVKAKDLGVGYAPGPTPYWVQEFGATF